ncbi:MAG: HAD-IA family hydrolase [Acidobacteriaceae bacterium]|nr:HAD-IA family hydrolase [Acidobacteriaceae bacterium]
MQHQRFSALFSDIGGVLGTNGWDARVRNNITVEFGLDSAEIDSRHHLMFDSYERGYMRFDDYLRYVFFASPREFTLDELREYTYSQSVAWPENIGFLKRFKTANQLKLALISNEGQGITEHRVGKFGLRDLADFMVISNFVHFRKPDPEIWHLALNLAQVKAAESIYIDDRELFANVAAELGFTAIHHVSLASTRERLQNLGLETA